MIQIKHNKLRFPTGGRLTSWLFTKRGGVEFGTTEDKSIQWQGGGFEPGTSEFQVQCPTTRPRSPPLIITWTYGNGATLLFFKVWDLANGRTDSHVTTKILRLMGYQIFYGMGLRWDAFGVQELRYKLRPFSVASG